MTEFSIDDFMDRKEKEIYGLTIKESQVKNQIKLLDHVKNGFIPYKNIVQPPIDLQPTADQEKSALKKLCSMIIKRVDKVNLANRDVTMLTNDDSMNGPKVWMCLEFLMEHQEREHEEGVEQCSFVNLRKVDVSEGVLREKRWWYILEAWGVVVFDETDDMMVKLNDRLLF